MRDMAQLDQQEVEVGKSTGDLEGPDKIKGREKRERKTAGLWMRERKEKTQKRGHGKASWLLL